MPNASEYVSIHNTADFKVFLERPDRTRLAMPSNDADGTACTLLICL